MLIFPLVSYDSGADALVHGLAGGLLTFILYYLIRAIVRWSKRSAPKMKAKVSDTINEVQKEIEWRKSINYHSDLLKLMEEGFTKRQAENILTERHILEKKILSSAKDFTKETDLPLTTSTHLAPEQETKTNQSETSIKSDINILTNNHQYDDENALLGDVLTAFSNQGLDLAIQILMEHGFNHDEAMDYISEYVHNV